MLQVVSGRENSKPAKRMQRQQLRVAGDNHIRPPMHRDLQKFVVARIAAGAYEKGNLDRHGIL